VRNSQNKDSSSPSRILISSPSALTGPISFICNPNHREAQEEVFQLV
jgi:hypothetical protein